ncbi:MAG: hypothetical protein ABI706_14715 [Ilumatobacteraceae bacterium]
MTRSDRIVRRLLLCLVGVALLAACGDNAAYSSEGTTPAVGAAVGAPSTTPVASNRTAVPESLAFSAPRVGGGTINLADFAGKPVLLWFWAPT